MSSYPLRVPAAVARQILCVNRATFWKVVDANPQLVHRIPGETRRRYLTAELLKLLGATRCAAEGRETSK